jgi:hypothetical protein
MSPGSMGILNRPVQELWNSKHSIDKSMEFQGPQIAPKVEEILGFHWLIVLHHLHSVIGAKYDN